MANPNDIEVDDTVTVHFNNAKEFKDATVTQVPTNSKPDWIFKGIDDKIFRVHPHQITWVELIEKA